MKRSSHPKGDEQLCDSLGQADFEVRAPPRGSGLRAHLVPGPPVTKRGRDNCRQEHRGASSWRAHCVPGYLTVFTSSAPWALEAKCAQSRASRFRRREGHWAVTPPPGPSSSRIGCSGVVLGPYTRS